MTANGTMTTMTIVIGSSPALSSAALSYGVGVPVHPLRTGLVSDSRVSRPAASLVIDTLRPAAASGGAERSRGRPLALICRGSPCPWAVRQTSGLLGLPELARAGEIGRPFAVPQRGEGQRLVGMARRSPPRRGRGRGPARPAARACRRGSGSSRRRGRCARRRRTRRSLLQQHVGRATRRNGARPRRRPGRSSSAARRACPAPRPSRRSSWPPRGRRNGRRPSARRRRRAARSGGRSRPACRAARRPRSAVAWRA